jgi:hypothetical protein
LGGNFTFGLMIFGLVRIVGLQFLIGGDDLWAGEDICVAVLCLG